MPDGIWRKSFNATWGEWIQFEGDWSNGPGAVCRPGTTAIDVIKLGTDAALWQLELPN